MGGKSPIFQTHLYTSVGDTSHHIPLNILYDPLKSHNLIICLLLNPPTDHPNPRRGRKPRVLLHHRIGNLRASCRQLLLVSTRLSFQWISNKISNQENIGHLSDAKPWKTMGKTILWMDLKHEQLIITDSVQSEIGMRLLQMWGGYNHKNWEWRLGAFKNVWILGMCQNSSLKTWHNIWRFREDASQKPWIPL